MSAATPTDPAAFREKLLSVGVMRRTGTTTREQQLAKDRDAYKRLRAEGLQPRTVAGSADLEATADHRHEIEMAHVFPSARYPDRAETWKKVDEGLEAGRSAEEWRQGNA
jgi:hypothetical protein